jgi:hypothetical protein
MSRFALIQATKIRMARTQELLTSDLTGWRMAGPGGFRVVSGGVIESHGGSGIFWYADEVFENFLLTVEWRLSREDDNSGVFLRIPPLTDSPQPAIDRGYEVQIDDRGLDPERRLLGSPLHLTGAIYRLAPVVRRCSRPVREWNLFEVTANGPLIAVKLNGEDVCRLDNASREPCGHIGLQNHHDGSAVQFRALRLLAL